MSNGRSNCCAISAVVVVGGVHLGAAAALYRRKREAKKSLAPDGSPTNGTTRGRLRRRPITATPAQTRLVGKESDKLLERLTGETTNPLDYQLDLGVRQDAWTTLVLPILREIGAQSLRALTGDAHSTIYDTLQGRTPSPTRLPRLLSAAEGYAAAHLRTWKISVRRRADSLTILANYRRERYERTVLDRVCAVCGTALPTTARADARYCSPRCRKAASRANQQRDQRAW